MIRYCKIHTTSDEESMTSPSSERELVLAEMLYEELKAIGVKDVTLTDSGNVYAKLEATEGYGKYPKIGFIAHMDTAPDFSGENVDPQVIVNYDGKDIPLPKSDRIIRVSDFPHLKEKAGKTIITAGGDTLLGADDKAGIAEIMTLCDKLLKENIPHGTICVAFTPDEEIGRGTESFDLAKFGADYAYTLDGGEVGEVVWECFNAASAAVIVHGNNVHPGSAKGIMVNACLVAAEYNALLPAKEIPSETEHYEGFYHLTNITGSVEEAKMFYILRDHSREKLHDREYEMNRAASVINDKYGLKTVEVHLREGYHNMAEKIKEHYEVVEKALRATERVGLKPSQEPVRGGTDGATLTEMGLPCPNLGTGSYAFHGPYEHSVAEDMDLAVDILVEIIHEFCK